MYGGAELNRVRFRLRQLTCGTCGKSQRNARVGVWYGMGDEMRGGLSRKEVRGFAKLKKFQQSKINLDRAQ